MNTILTDDEGHRAVNSATSGTSLEIFRKVEAAVLAKLREQEPVGFVTSLQWRTYQTEQVLKITRTRQPEHDFVAPIYAAPQPAVVQVPQGWKLVPVEPTEAMCNPNKATDAVAKMAAKYRREAWAYMLAAAPEAPAQTIPAELDVRRILLDVVPGDGNGQEVYAKNVDDVVRVLTELSEKAETQPIPAPWHEAVKVAREALATVQASIVEEGISAGRREYRSELFTRMTAALAQLDSLGGGE